MTNVVEFKKPEPVEPHTVGDAVCIGCDHKWLAVAPVGTVILDCPACSLPKGVYVYPVSPGEGRNRWACNCDCQLFYVVENGFLCSRCGVEQNF